MSTSFPKFRLYESDGVTLVYEFTNVTDMNPPIFEDDTKDFIIHSGLRGNGDITAPGGSSSYDLTLSFVLISQGSTDQEKYENLVSQVQAIKTAIPTGDHFILKIDKSSSTTEDIKVIRYSRLDLPIPSGQKMVNYQRVNITFLAKSY